MWGREAKGQNEEHGVASMLGDRRENRKESGMDEWMLGGVSQTIYIFFFPSWKAPQSKG